MKPGKTAPVIVGGALAAGALAAYAFLVEPRWLQVTHTRIPLPGRPPAFRLRLALLADLHAGRTPLGTIRRACRKAMATRPDLIALSGDLVAATATTEELERVMEALDTLLDAPLGVFVVPGNHDHDAGIEAWEAALGRCKTLIDLTNRAEQCTVDGRLVWIAGVDDLDAGRPRPDLVLPDRDEQDVAILLAHNPDLAEWACDQLGPVDLVLSGHTHGGQVRLPFMGALQNPARHDDLYEAGLTQRPWAPVYVSRGIGTSRLTVRFLTRPEVAVLDLVGEDRVGGEGKKVIE